MKITFEGEQKFNSFKELECGQCFMTLNGLCVYLKLAPVQGKDNALCFDNYSTLLIDDNQEVIPLDSELLIKYIKPCF